MIFVVVEGEQTMFVDAPFTMMEMTSVIALASQTIKIRLICAAPKMVWATSARSIPLYTFITPYMFFTDATARTKYYFRSSAKETRHYYQVVHHTLSQRILLHLNQRYERDAGIKGNCWMPLFRKYIKTLPTQNQ